MTTSPQNPVTFSEMGKIIYAGDHYILPIALDINDLLTMTQPLLDGLLDTRGHFDSIMEQLSERPRGHPHADFVQNHFPNSMQQHLLLLMDDLDTRVNDLKSLLKTLANYGKQPMADPLRLHKRSPFDFVGSAASYLFGLVDHAEFKSMSDIMDHLVDMTEEERRTLNMHSTILNVTALHVDALEENQKRTTDAIRTLDEETRAINLTLSSTQQSVYTLDNSVRMISALSYASTAMNDLDYIYNRFSTGIGAMTRGVLSPEILPPTKLISILDELNKVNLRALWPSTDPYIPLYYKFSSVLPVKTDIFLFYVLLPLYPEPNNEMNLFKVTALPFPINPNVTISYGELPPFFAISADHSLHSDLLNADLENCRQLSSIYFCDEARPLFTSNYPSCTYSLYTGLKVDKYCDKHVGTSLLRPLVLRDSDRWLYATSSPMHMTIVCPSKTTTVSLDIGVGSIETPSTCRITSPFAQLPTAKNIKRLGTEVVNFTLIRPFNISLSDSEKLTVGIFNDTLYQDILSLTGSPVPLHSLSQEIGQLRTIQQHRVHAATQSHYALILSLTATIVIILTIVLSCYMKRVLKENRDRFGAPSGNPIINLFSSQPKTYRPVSDRQATPGPVVFHAADEVVQIPQPAPRA